MLQFALDLFNKNSMLKFEPLTWGYDAHLANQIFSLGFVVFIRQALVSTSFLAINYVAASFGTDVVAAIGLVQRTNGLIIFVLIGYSQALLPFVGYNYGAKNGHRIQEAIKSSLLWASVFTLIAAIALVVFSKGILLMFTDDVQVIYYGRNFFFAIGLC